MGKIVAIYLMVLAGVFLGAVSNYTRNRVVWSADEHSVGREIFAEPVVISNTDTSGHPIQLVFRKVPERVVAIGENAAEMLLALGMEDRLVAVVEAVDDGEQLKKEYPSVWKKYDIPFLRRTDKETLLMMKPDLIIGWPNRLTDRFLGSTQFWQARGVTTYIPESAAYVHGNKTVEMEYGYIRDMGNIFNVSEKAERIIQRMQDEIQISELRNSLGEKPTTLTLAFSRDLIINYGEGSLPADIVKRAGGTMLPAGRYISYEELLMLNPDVLFVFRQDSQYKKAVEEVYGKVKLRGLSCVQNQNVYGISFFWLYNSGVSTAKGIQVIAEGLHKGHMLRMKNEGNI